MFNFGHPRVGENHRKLALVNPAFSRHSTKFRSFLPFSALGTTDAELLARRRDGPAASSGDTK
jgi:hypothetical protein